MVRRLICPLAVLLCLAVVARADQRDIRLDGLFARLAATEDALEALRIEAAIRDIWRIYTGDSYDVIEFLNRGHRAIGRGEYQSAEIAFGGVIDLAPDFAEGWHSRGRLRYRVGDYQGAIADLQSALALEPRHFAALSHLGDCYVALDRPDRALAAFEAALAIHPHLPRAHAAIEHLRTLLEGDPI